MSGPAGAAPGPGRAEPGRAGERTALAWRRTALSVTVVALLAARLAAESGLGPAAPLLTAAALIGLVPMVALAYRRNGSARLAQPAGRGLPLSALAGVAYAVLGVFLVILGRH